MRTLAERLAATVGRRNGDRPSTAAYKVAPSDHRSDSGVDLLRVIDLQRKKLHARDIELDALLEVRQALADLAAAVGDPSVAVTATPAP